MKYSFIFLLITVSIVACKPTEPEIRNIEANDLFESYGHFKLEINTLEATGLGDDRFNDRLPNYISGEYQEMLRSSFRDYLEQANSVDTTGLDQTGKLALEALKWDCNIKLEGLNNPIVTVTSPMFGLPSFTLAPINQIFSLHLYFSQIAGGGSLQPFKEVKDYTDWLNRTDDFISFLDTVMENMRQGMEKGEVLPRVIVEKMVAQLDDLITENPEDHLYYQPVNNMPGTVPELDASQLRDEYRYLIADRLVPKFRELQAFLRDEYLSSAMGSTGISAWMNGKDEYQYLIKYHTTTNLTADEIFELGEKEVARITGEMEKVMKEIGFEGTVLEFFESVRQNPDLMPYKDPQEVLDHYNGIHEKMKGKLAELFDLTPKADFEVRRTEAFREASASAEYSSGSRDGSRPGVFYVPIPDVESYNILTSEALFLHEAIPGHHYQISLQQENEDLPEWMHAEGLGVYVEGWALYCESLGKELGLYDDPYQYFGMLSQEMHRAIRLVVDAGLHSRGWTREQAIEYSLDHEAISEEGATAEIERYMVAPGQALAYKVGQLKILELRERAKDELGDKFDIRQFHNQVLSTGSLPLVLLEQKINDWINSQK